MTLANDSFLRIADTSTSGTALATHLVSAKEYPVVMIADDSGHIQQTLPTYSWWVPPVSTTVASKLFADLYNSSDSTALIEIRGIWAIPKSDVAVSPTVGVEVDLYRTNAIGTSGTTFGYNGGTNSTASHFINPIDTTNSSAFFMSSGISARTTPVGGATIAAIYWAQYVFTSPTNAATYIAAFTNLLPVSVMTQRITLRPGQGILYKQGSVVGAGSIAFLTHFTVI